MADEYGRHAINCRFGGRRVRLHDGVCDALTDAHRSLGISSSREVVVSSLATPSLQQPRIDIDMDLNASVSRTLLDVCIHDVASSLLHRAEDKKFAKYRNKDPRLHRNQLRVAGLAMNVHGHTGPNFQAHLNMLARHSGTSRQCAGSTSGFMNHTTMNLQYLSLTILALGTSTQYRPSYRSSSLGCRCWRFSRRGGQ